MQKRIVNLSEQKNAGEADNEKNDVMSYATGEDSGDMKAKPNYKPIIIVGLVALGLFLLIRKPIKS